MSLFVLAWTGRLEAQAPESAERAPSTGAVTEDAAGLALPESRATELVWQEEWSTFRMSEFIATGTLGLGILAVHYGIDEPSEANWTGAVLLDSSARLTLRRDAVNDQELMGEASDWLLRGLMVWPFLDAGIALTVHGSPEVAGQMFAINGQSFALTFLVTELTKKLIGRERPYGQQCAPDDDRPDCNVGNRYKSFLSGHTSMSFTGAGLVCAHHENLPLYGGGAADSAACASAIAAATTVGMLRIAADKHYLSDVLMGAALGMFSGYLLPNWLHYDLGEEDPDTGAPSGGTFTPMATPSSVGFGYQRVWY